MLPQSSKVSYPGPSGIHPYRAAKPPRNLPTLLAILAACAFPLRSEEVPAWLQEKPWIDSVLVSGLDRMYRADYAGADSLFTNHLVRRSLVQGYFQGLNHFQRFNDLGDMSSLQAAESLWTAVADSRIRNSDSRSPVASANIDLYLGLSTLQLSYVASIRGSGVKSARLGRKAASQLRPLAGKAEADAALALYDYYKATLLKGLSWVPFVEADAASPLARLEASVPKSRYLAEVLQTSLLWLYYDARRFEEGLRRIEAFLSRYPDHRTARAMRADFLYRRALARRALAQKKGLPDTLDLFAARDIQESLRKEYEIRLETCPSPKCIPLGYLASVGNLVKIYGKLGQPDLRRKYATIWSSPKFRPFLSWMPGSLKREVDAETK